MARRPNVVWIVADQHRAQALSCAGDENVSTPHLDLLARTGMYFRSAVSGYPLCCPFRGSMLTGRYPHRCVPGHLFPLPEGQPTVAGVFRENGYRTCYVGKWHLSGYRFRPGERLANYIVPPEKRGGFETWYGYENNNSQWDCWIHGERDGRPFHERLDGYETDALTDIAVDYLESQALAAEPFFCVISVQPPHDPYVAPAGYMARHHPRRVSFRGNVPQAAHVRAQAAVELAGYYAMIENLDDNVGRVVGALDRLGILRNTHVMYFGDHGDMHGSHGYFRKTTPFEEAIRIPFIIGGEIPMASDGRRCGETDVLLNHVDIAPTTLGLCGLDAPSCMEGTDYSYLRMADRPKPEQIPESAYLQNVVPTNHNDSVARPYRGIVTRDGYKYVCFEGMPWLLFNLNDDPLEQINLAHYSQYAALLGDLNRRLVQWGTKLEDPFRFPEV